ARPGEPNASDRDFRKRALPRLVDDLPRLPLVHGPSSIRREAWVGDPAGQQMRARIDRTQGGPHDGGPSSVANAALDRLNVRGGWALRTLLGVVGHLRALGQRFETAAGDRRMVNEEVLALIIGRDESEALVVAEPLNGSSCHGFP